LRAPASKKWFALVAAPLSASMILLAVPGPCTTFNDVDAGADAAPKASCDAALRFDFYGADSATCQSLANELCCPQLITCAGEPMCKEKVACINGCAPPRDLDSGCVLDCGITINTFTGFLSELATCFYDGGVDTSACQWVGVAGPK
jgi:hypothetical protein